MNHIILQTGKIAEVPYFFDKLYVNLYSVEELCCCLVENAEMLDQEIVSKSLADWLDVQCGLSELAHALYALVNQKGSAGAFVGTILEYVGLYPAEKSSEVEHIIKNSADLTPFEKKKAKADHIMQNGHYFIALEQYESLLSELPREERKLRSSLLHNMGTANARLFMFGQAAEAFLAAYRLDGTIESLQQHLIARRMSDDDKDYLDYAAGHPEWYEVSLQVERMFNACSGQFDATQENRMLFTLHVCKEEGSGAGGNITPYYDEIEKLTDGLKERYRESITG